MKYLEKITGYTLALFFIGISYYNFFIDIPDYLLFVSLICLVCWVIVIQQMIIEDFSFVKLYDFILRYSYV